MKTSLDGLPVSADGSTNDGISCDEFKAKEAKRYERYMERPNFGLLLGGAWLLACVSSTGFAQIYKWGDADGKTHYSENKEDAGKAKAETLKHGSSSTSTHASAFSSDDWKEKDRQFRERQIRQSYNTREAQPAARPPESLSGGKTDESDASKCNLARDIVSGAVRHGNGAPIDKYDIEVAKNDIRRYCR